MGMLLEKVEIGASGLARVEAEGRGLSLRVDLWKGLGRDPERLAPGVELGEEEALDLELAVEATEAESRGAVLLGRAEQPRFVLRAKLLERGFSDRASRLALERLEEAGLLSDRRFAEAWLRARIGKALRKGAGTSPAVKAEGPATLIAALRTRGVDEATAKAALDSVLDPSSRGELLVAALRCLEASRSGSGTEEGRGELGRGLRVLGFRGEEVRDALETRET